MSKKKNKKILETDSGGAEREKRVRMTGQVTLSFKHILDCKDYGPIINKGHSHHKQAKKYNEEILKELIEMSKKEWDHLHQASKKGGIELIELKILKAKQEEFKNIAEQLGVNSKIYVKRFNSQQCRCLGFRKDDTFYIVCFDYDLTLYEHQS